MLHYKQIENLITNVFGKDKDIVGLEIGTNTGSMERHLLAAFPKLFMFGIDKNDHKLNDWNEPRLKFIHSTSDDAVKNFTPGQFNFVYIDGEHTYDQVKKDILNYLPFIKDNGILAGHDYVIEPGNQHECVRIAVDEIFKDVKVHFGEDLTWWVFKKDIKW